MIQAKKTVLVVEDDEDTCLLLKEALEDNYFICEIAPTAAEGLQKAETSPPHLILLDLMLPGMSGFGFMREVRNNPKLKGIPVVVLTALADNDIADQSLELGAVGYLTKAINQKELISVIRDYTVQ